MPRTPITDGSSGGDRRSGTETRRNLLISSPTQTSQDKGANSSAAHRCVCLGRVLSGYSRRHTSTIHEEATLQRCLSAAAVAVACSPHVPHKTCSQTYVPSVTGVLGGSTPQGSTPQQKLDARRGFGRACDILSPRSAPEYGACLSTAPAFPQRPWKGAARRTASWWTGQTVEERRVCTYTGMEN